MGVSKLLIISQFLSGTAFAIDHPKYKRPTSRIYEQRSHFEIEHVQQNFGIRPDAASWNFSNLTL